ncbi:hypothetical protein HY480_03135 [Candidatus Uhrbacteria bacterium]|nr:hypothetical protein [Candidatus Uhrbacteria bacterium]
MAASRYAVDGDTYMQVDGRMTDIKRQLRQRGGSSLDPQRVLGALQAITEGRFADPANAPNALVLPQRPRLIHGLFTPPEQQLANVREWMAQQIETWHDIPEAWFTNLGPPPQWPDGRRLQCIVLELALPDLPETKDMGGHIITSAVPGYIRTVRDLWDIISGQNPNHMKWKDLQLDAEHLLLLDGATYTPGLRWRILDLGTNWDKVNGIAPATVRDPRISPNVDGFAALACHPRFVQRMDGVNVPHLWIPGFRVTASGYDPRRLAPTVSFDRVAHQVDLAANLDDCRGSGYAVPSRLGV